MVRSQIARWSHGNGNRNPRLEDAYEVDEVLGRGSYGVVRLVRDRDGGETYACKTISKDRLSSRRDVEEVRREVELLNLLTPHINVAGLREVFEDQTAIHIILDYCKGGELFARVVKKGSFSEKEAAHFFWQMVEVVRHCHGLGVMHRDIKPENFLLTGGEDYCGLKACDFGLSTYFKPGQRFTEVVGSAYYVAPEVLGRNYGPECDLWSLGVVLYIMLSGLPPFWGRSEREVFASILNADLDFATQPWPAVSAEAKDLVVCLLQRDPARRPRVVDLPGHPWLRARSQLASRPLPPIVIQRIKCFATMNKFKKAAVLCAAQHLSRDQIQGLRELFKSFDKNGDGVVSFEELQEALLTRQPDLPVEELQQVMEDVDLDKNGFIDYEEFLAATANLSQLEREETFIKAFRKMDRDGSGVLTPDEVAVAVSASGEMTEGEARQLIACHDLNKDGVIDYSEFVEMLRSQDAELAGESSGGAATPPSFRHRRLLTML